MSTFDNKIISKTRSKIIYNETYNIDLSNFEYDISNQKKADIGEIKEFYFKEAYLKESYIKIKTR